MPHRVPSFVRLAVHKWKRIYFMWFKMLLRGEGVEGGTVVRSIRLWLLQVMLHSKEKKGNLLLHHFPNSSNHSIKMPAMEHTVYYVYYGLLVLMLLRPLSKYCKLKAWDETISIHHLSHYTDWYILILCKCNMHFQFKVLSIHKSIKFISPFHLFANGSGREECAVCSWWLWLWYFLGLVVLASPTMYACCGC